MKNRIFAVLLVVSLVLTTTLTAKTIDNALCMRTQSVVQSMTNSTLATVVHNHTPNNHNIQEFAVIIEKTYNHENPADYMEGLTAYSKRSIYVGEAEYCRLPVRINR